MAVERLREINVFCSEHRQRFFAPLYKRISCEVTRHTLAENFPQQDFWEFCCDCQTFFFSETNKNRDLAASCPVCYRTPTRRYLCHECRTICVQTDESPAENAFSVKLQGFVEPSCPACGASTTALVTHSHKCRKDSTAFRTTLAICAFCSEPTFDPEILSESAGKRVATNEEKQILASFAVTAARENAFCPACGSVATWTNGHCPHCQFDFSLFDSERPLQIESAKTTSAFPDTVLALNNSEVKRAGNLQKKRFRFVMMFLAVLTIIGAFQIAFRSFLKPETPKISELRLHEAPPANMVYVPGGEFFLGRDEGGRISERPAHKVCVDPFFIDATEVTNEEYRKFIEATKHKPPKTWRNNQFPPGDAKLPVTGVTWDDANAFAKWAGKRLPTEAEWEFAARGSDGRIYPWGNQWSSELVNADNKVKAIQPVGTNKGASPFGALDMSGNAWEWTADDFKPYPNGKLPSHIPKGEVKTLRGGAFDSKPDFATTTFRVGYSARQASDYSRTSFRCVKDLNP